MVMAILEKITVCACLLSNEGCHSFLKHLDLSLALTNTAFSTIQYYRSSAVGNIRIIAKLLRNINFYLVVTV